MLVAARVMETPHLLLVGDGATAFARRLGFPDHDPMTEARAEQARARRRRARGRGRRRLRGRRRARGGGRTSAALWNFEGEPPTVARLDESRRLPRFPAGPARGDAGCDTVGAVVRDAHGRFAATASTGGTLYMLRGRVGDSPLMGAGVFAGPHGAVAATGVGEEIARRFLAQDRLRLARRGHPPGARRAARRRLFPEVIDVGLLVVGKDGQAVAANRDMASAILVGLRPRDGAGQVEDEARRRLRGHGRGRRALPDLLLARLFAGRSLPVGRRVARERPPSTRPTASRAGCRRTARATAATSPSRTRPPTPPRSGSSARSSGSTTRMARTVSLLCFPGSAALVVRALVRRTDGRLEGFALAAFAVGCAAAAVPGSRASTTSSART